MTREDIIRMALEALEYIDRQDNDRDFLSPEECCDLDDAITAIREALAEQPAQQEPVAWMPIEQMYPQAKAIDILMGDGSILCAVLPQFDGDLWWEGSGTGEKFIDPKYADVTHWRIHNERTSPQPAQHSASVLEQNTSNSLETTNQEAQDEPVAHSIVAGALFDFMGWLTSRRERLALSSTDDAAPAADAIKDFAHMRSLSINDAKVQEWQKHLAAPPPRKSLTDEQPSQVDPCIDGSCSCCWTHLDEQPASKPWVSLTDEEIDEGQRQSWVEKQAFESAVWWAEAKLKEKNT